MRLHMSATREYLIQRTNEENWREIFEGATSYEATIEALRTGPKLYPIGKCDNFDEEKGCRGHEEKGEK